jgi:Tfp pilus assembly protein PilN
MRAVNLLPREQPKRLRKRSGVAFQLALVSPLVVGSLLAAGYLLTSSKVNERKGTLQALRDELAELPSPAPQSPSNPELVLQRDQRISALASALQGRVAWDRILGEISAVLPEDVWLSSLSTQAAAAAPAPAPAPQTTTQAGETTTTATATSPTSPAPAPTTALTLAGSTYSQESVARFLSRLAVIPELQDVKLVQSAQTTASGQGVVSFSIQAAVRAEAA